MMAWELEVLHYLKEYHEDHYYDLSIDELKEAFQIKEIMVKKTNETNNIKSSIK